MTQSPSQLVAACQFGSYRAEWQLEAEPETDPRTAIAALIEHQIGFHLASQSIPADEPDRELQRLRAQAQDIPGEQVGQLLLAAVACLQTWRQAKAAKDFSVVAKPFATLIERQRDLARAKAKSLSVFYGRAVSPYEALVDQYDPGRRLDFVQREFARLVPVAQSLLRDDTGAPLTVPCNEDASDALIRDIITRMGYDPAPPRGKLGISAHPFARRVGPDAVWLTGRKETDALLAALTMVHEGGHGRYYQGLPRETAGDWSGMIASEMINEGLALLSEHLLARRPAFAQYLSDRFAAVLDITVASEAILAELTRPERTRLRTDAKEACYPLHLALRLEIETALIDGDLDPMDLPRAWADASRRLLGFTPADDGEGCLQDIHLFAGYLGYFPCYLLGHMAAAQLWPAIAAALPELEAQIAVGDFAPLNGWLQQQVYRHGRTLTADALIEAATGKPFGADALIAHLQARYGAKS